METFPTLAGILHPVLWLADGSQLEDLSLAYDKPFSYMFHSAVRSTAHASHAPVIPITLARRSWLVPLLV